MDKKAIIGRLRVPVVLVLFSLLLGIASIFYGVRMPGKSYQAELPALDTQMQASRDRLSTHVYELAVEIGERHYQRREKLDEAAEYIENSFRGMGYNPVPEVYSDKLYRNVVVNLYGSQRRDEIVVVGAHYDTVLLSSGADDNASGVSMLLEIARELHGLRLSRTVKFIAFTNEEWPFFGRELMGSRVNAEHSFDRNEQIIGMISLEMVGYYSNEADSQAYPKPLNYFYPHQGNFIAFVSNFSSRNFLHETISEFRNVAKFPSEGLVAPQFLVPDIRRSDNYAFWLEGYPALMVTDTSNYRNRNYHTARDTHETLDYESMARIVSGLQKTISTLANK